jgi:hypothetical protein
MKTTPVARTAASNTIFQLQLVASDFAGHVDYAKPFYSSECEKAGE